MLNLIGNIFIWIAVIGVLPMMTLPLAWGIAGDKRPAAGLVWFVLTFAISGAGLLFTHLAVDLPAITLTEKYAIWFTAMAVFIGAVSALSTPSQFLTQASNLFSAITRKAGRATMWLIFVMALVQFASVILRYVFGINFIWAQESITYMHGTVFLIAGGYALLTNDHVRVDIFYRDASANHKARVDLFGTYLFLFPFCLLLLWTAAPYVGNAWAVGEGSTEQSGIQGVFLLKTLIPLFAILLSMAGFVIAAKATKTLKGNAS